MKERLTTGGRFHYACIAPGDHHYATSTELVEDCMWHGSDCEAWTLLVDPFEVRMLLADCAALSGASNISSKGAET